MDLIICHFEELSYITRQKCRERLVESGGFALTNRSLVFVVGKDAYLYPYGVFIGQSTLQCGDRDHVYAYYVQCY